jgi:site-specific recombinase XerD
MGNQPMGSSSAMRRVRCVKSDENLRVEVMDLDAPGKRRVVSYPGVDLFLVAGELEPAPSWWMLDLHKRRTSADTIETYRKGVELWLGALHQNGIAWHEATARTAQAFIDALVRRGNAENTVALRMAAVLAFYRWAFNQGFLRSLPFTKDSLTIPKGKTKSVVAHPKEEFARIAAALPTVSPGARRRDELVFECGRYMGLRRKEIIGLKAAEFLALDPCNQLNVIWTDPAYTKGRKTRAVLVPRLLAVRIQNYVRAYRDVLVAEMRKQSPRWAPPPNLFLTERGTPITEDYVSDTWGRCAKAAGIKSRFHNNRASFATHVADVAAELGQLPLPLVKDLLGHASQATSERYVHYSELRDRLLVSAHVVNDGYELETSP